MQTLIDVQQRFSPLGQGQQAESSASFKEQVVEAQRREQQRAYNFEKVSQALRYFKADTYPRLPC